MPHEVDASVELVEASVVQPELDLVGCHPGLKQLPARDDPVLALRESRNDPFGGSTE
jgi:hypothetical protein